MLCVLWKERRVPLKMFYKANLIILKAVYYIYIYAVANQRTNLLLESEVVSNMLVYN